MRKPAQQKLEEVRRRMSEGERDSERDLSSEIAQAFFDPRGRGEIASNAGGEVSLEKEFDRKRKGCRQEMQVVAQGNGEIPAFSCS